LTAYSFAPQFVAPIQAGTKRQTIRAHGRRSHVKPGGLIQLYTGMRTKSCRKIRDDVVCLRLLPVTFDLTGVASLKGAPLPGAVEHARLHVDRMWCGQGWEEEFARRDGFDSFAEMVAFWIKAHGTIRFEGVCIQWGEPG
jgi:hypothetical protein